MDKDLDLLKKKFQKELKSLKNGSIALALVPSKYFEDANLHVINFLVDRHEKGSYISVNKPYTSMVKLLDEKKIKSDDVFFIDCITKELSGSEISKNCCFVDSPSNLTEIAIALEPVFNSGKHRFILLDSIDTLMVYNSHESVVKFMHFLTGKMRLHDLSGVLLTLPEKSDERLIAELSQFCDKVIDLR